MRGGGLGGAVLQITYIELKTASLSNRRVFESQPDTWTIGDATTYINILLFLLRSNITLCLWAQKPTET